jgi:hypothetical protein
MIVCQSLPKQNPQQALKDVDDLALRCEGLDVGIVSRSHVVAL